MIMPVRLTLGANSGRGSDGACFIEGFDFLIAGRKGEKSWLQPMTGEKWWKVEKCNPLDDMIG
jgi:hypothetical protein